MSNFEVIEKAINEHGEAVEQLKSGIDARLCEIEQKMARRGGESYTREVASPVNAFVKSAQVEAMREGANTTGRVELKGGELQVLRKAITSATYDVQPQRAQGLYDNPQERLALLDLLPVMPVSSGQFEYMALTTTANGAAYQVAEGDLKEESTPGFEIRTATIATIAHWTRASLQILSDAPALERQLSDLMRYGAQAKLEAEIINGTGGTGQITGLMTQATAFTHSAAEPADRIGEAVTSLGATGWNANAVVMNHQDWFAIASSKNADDDYIMGSPRNPAPANLWGIPVVLSAAMAAGTALVMDTAQTAILDRQQATVMMSREDRDNLITNQATLLAELRAGFAVFAPGAVLSVDLTEA